MCAEDVRHCTCNNPINGIQVGFILTIRVSLSLFDFKNLQILLKRVSIRSLV